MDKTPLASAALPLDAIVFPSVEEEAEPVRAAANDSGSDRLASDQVHRAVNEAVALYLLGASGIFFFFFQFIYNSFTIQSSSALVSVDGPDLNVPFSSIR